ncbi:hypothetical protein GCM10018779_07690 [Streptomyces griseocarneus]|nr:hypothetical protein GCM10018779_07690 [Streptomyces griseocarneus]
MTAAARRPQKGLGGPYLRNTTHRDVTPAAGPGESLAKGRRKGSPGGTVSRPKRPRHDEFLSHTPCGNFFHLNIRRRGQDSNLRGPMTRPKLLLRPPISHSGHLSSLPARPPGAVHRNYIDIPL